MTKSMCRLVIVAFFFVCVGRSTFAAEPAPPASEPAAGTRIVHPLDGAIMVYVPAGSFTMGFEDADAQMLAAALGDADPARYAPEEWYPRRQVYVAGFFIDQHEVTWERWNRFLKATGYQPRTSKGPAYTIVAGTNADLYPATNIHWDEAQKYANWAGKALPYEAQWEKAARGTDGRFYPWGNQPPNAERARIVQRGAKEAEVEWHPLMVGSLPRGASPYGVMDMAGNAFEWTREWYEPYPNNPRFAEVASNVGGHRFAVLRGGSFYMPDFQAMSAKRFGFEAGETYYHVGLRTVWEPPAGYFESEAFRQAQAAVAARQAELAAVRQQDRATPTGP